MLIINYPAAGTSGSASYTVPADDDGEGFEVYIDNTNGHTGGPATLVVSCAGAADAKMRIRCYLGCRLLPDLEPGERRPECRAPGRDLK